MRKLKSNVLCDFIGSIEITLCTIKRYSSESQPTLTYYPPDSTRLTSWVVYRGLMSVGSTMPALKFHAPSS